MAKQIPRISELSPEYALMGFLFFEPLHGYELHRQLVFHLREVWRIPQNQAYNILKRLAKEDLIKPIPQEENKHQGTVCFTLTDTGRRKFEHWLYTPTPCSARAIRIEFLTRLFFATQISPDLVARFMQEQDAAIQAALLRLEERLALVPLDQTFNRYSLELRIRQLYTLRSWLQSNEPVRLK